MAIKGYNVLYPKFSDILTVGEGIEVRVSVNADSVSDIQDVKLTIKSSKGTSFDKIVTLNYSGGSAGSFIYSGMLVVPDDPGRRYFNWKVRPTNLSDSFTDKSYYVIIGKPAENVKTAYVMFNGQKYVSTYDGTTKSWSVEISAPSESSWNQVDHVYKAEIFSEDLAGNVSSLGSTDTTYGDQLKIRVLEKTPPIVDIVQPNQDDVLGTSTQTIEILMYDSGGSGINASSSELKINDVVYSVTPSLYEELDGVKTYKVVYTASNLPDGINNVEFSITDNDGNTTTKSVSFVISTTAPSLEVSTPTEGLITNATSVTVTGSTYSLSEYTQIAKVTINGVETEVGNDGYFSKEVDLSSGENTITVVSQDTIGKTTSVTRTVTCDTNAPIITDVHTEATTVDVGGVIRITFRVVDV